MKLLSDEKRKCNEHIVCLSVLQERRSVRFPFVLLFRRLQTYNKIGVHTLEIHGQRSRTLLETYIH